MLGSAVDADDADKEAIALRAKPEASAQHEAELESLRRRGCIVSDNFQLQHRQRQLQEEHQRHMTFPMLKSYHKDLPISNQCRQTLLLFRLRRLLRL